MLSTVVHSYILIDFTNGCTPYVSALFVGDGVMKTGIVNIYATALATPQACLGCGSYCGRESRTGNIFCALSAADVASGVPGANVWVTPIEAKRCWRLKPRT